jgi:hypothetical protein
MQASWRLAISVLVVFWMAPFVRSQSLIPPDWWHGIRTDCAPGQISTMTAEPGVVAPPNSGKWHKRIACAVDFFSDTPAHLAAGSVVPGSGFGAGVSILKDFSGGSKYRELSGGGVFTTGGFWSAKGQFLFQPFAYDLSHNGRRCLGPFCTKDRFNIKVYVLHEDLRSMDFFGLGPAAGSSPKFNFGERETTAGISASLPLVEWMRIVATIEGLDPRIAPSADPTSVRQNFTEATLPGLTTQPLFMHYDNLVEFHKLPEPPYDAIVTAGYSFYQALDSTRYSFGQFHLAGQATKKLHHNIEHAPGSFASHFCPKTAKKAWTCDYGEFTFLGGTVLSRTGSGQAEPFYYQPTLGGQNIEGNETLRAYPNYRFRAPDTLLFQAEYSHDFGIHFEYKHKKDQWNETHRVDWHAFAAYMFYDAGTVGFTTADLGLDRMRQDAGVGLKVKLAGTVAFHTYLAMGASGGPHWGFNFGKVL